MTVGYIFWLVLTIIFTIIEFAIPALVTVWFAFAAALTVFVSLISDSMKVEITFFTVVSLLSIIFLRPYARAILSKNKDNFSKIYKDFLNKKYSILIGTQIIAKGLHFPDVTLVGVINSDIILNFPDFRSGEKTFQLLTQVSGRAGRAGKKGKVIIQTYEPENNVIKDSKEENYELFYNREINSRKVFSYPPFSKILNIGFSSEDEKRLIEVSREFYEEIKNQDIELYGPMPSMVYKVQKRYRMNIFAKGSRAKIEMFKRYLKKKLDEFNDGKVRIVVDIDPINLM